MASNNNIFCATNPTRMADALWRVMTDGNPSIPDMLIFLPSRRAVRSVEKMIVEKMGGAAVLPQLVALGEGSDDADDADAAGADDGVVSDMMRICVLAKLLSADASIGNISTALPVARDLVRMTDYLENEGIDVASVDWAELVDARYAAHFMSKARILNIISRVMPAIAPGGLTRAARRNADIRAWIDVISRGDYSRVIVCASTASVPATADLMAAIAGMDHGRIILSGRIAGRACDMELDTHPYNAEYKFLSRIGRTPADVVPIDVGRSDIDFFNRAFGNVISDASYDLPNCHIIECARESEEAAAVAEIASRAVGDGKTVLVITPDAAANQRIAAEFAFRGIAADFSGGMSGAMTCAGRAILNMFDAWINANTPDEYTRRMRAASGDLFQMISDAVANNSDVMYPAFDVADAASCAVWDALAELSACMRAAGIDASVHDARAFVADALAAVSVRPPYDDAARVCVLGTIESRMQTADVVILTGLNDGMFPARGYENAWLPRPVARAIGLPSPDRKVSLMSLDFMNLSCGPCVYWMRSCMSGGVQTTASRFLSRVAAHRGRADARAADDILGAVRARDAVAACPLNPGRAAPGADWSDVYVTELELLIHNPYAFYARHILRLRPMDDWWAGPDARTFGNLVHGVIEDARDWSVDALVREMDARAAQIVGRDSVLFHFWHRRFLEIAPVVADAIGGRGAAEIAGMVRVPVGANGFRNVRARADRIMPGVVMDIKTGAAPSASKLSDGVMPQLPVEAYIMQSGGFGARYQSDAPRMAFVQLRGGDARVIEYDAEKTREYINAAMEKITQLFNQYTACAAEYEYRKTNDKKYQAWDDLARCDD